VVGREQKRELAPGQEQELVQERGQAWVVLTRITLNNELHPADWREEICRQVWILLTTKKSMTLSG